MSDPFHGKGFDEALAIRVVVEDRHAAVAAIQDVVDCPGILDSQFAGHDGRGPGTPVVNFKTPLSAMSDSVRRVVSDVYSRGPTV